MAGQITIAEKVATANSIRSAATRSLAQFTNAFDSVVSDLGAFEDSLVGVGLDQDTLDEIATIKAAIITEATTQIEARLAVLQGLAGE